MPMIIVCMVKHKFLYTMYIVYMIPKQACWKKIFIVGGEGGEVAAFMACIAITLYFEINERKTGVDLFLECLFISGVELADTCWK